jgi:hypothetical protein
LFLDLRLEFSPFALLERMLVNVAGLQILVLVVKESFGQSRSTREEVKVRSRSHANDHASYGASCGAVLAPFPCVTVVAFFSFA